MSAPRSGFTTIQNSGSLEGITNQCMFISILHYLRCVRMDNTITLRELRRIGGLGPDTTNTMFDIDDQRFVQAIRRIANHYNIQINVHYANRNGEADGRWLGQPAVTFGRSREVVPVVAFGLHFELIVSSGITPDLPITDDALRRAGTLSVHRYVPIIMTSEMNQIPRIPPPPPAGFRGVYRPGRIDVPTPSSISPVSSINQHDTDDSNGELINQLLIGIIENKETIAFMNKEIQSSELAIAQHRDEIKSRELILELSGGDIDADAKQLIQAEISSLNDIVSRYIDESTEKSKLVNNLEKAIQASTELIQKLVK